MVRKQSKLIKRIALGFVAVGIIAFMIGFSMNKFTFSGFDKGQREWYQIMMWD